MLLATAAHFNRGAFSFSVINWRLYRGTFFSTERVIRIVTSCKYSLNVAAGVRCLHFWQVQNGSA